MIEIVFLCCCSTFAAADHVPVAIDIVFVLGVALVPAICQERNGLVFGERAGETVDVIAQIRGDLVALGIERNLRIVGDRFADGDDGVFLLQIDGVEFECFLCLALIETCKVDEARLQLRDIF